MDQKARSEKIRLLFQSLNRHKIDELDAFYAPHIRFIDPAGETQGIGSLKAYMRRMYDNVIAIRFDFEQEFVDGDHHIFMWTMYLTSKNLNKKQSYSITGSSVFHFDPQTNLVDFHRDYFDLGELIYEKIPVLGALISPIKKWLHR